MPSPHLPPALLRAEGLGKRFGRNRLFRALGFELAGGGSLAITGPNGSGKSTLIQILAGLQTPDRGSVSLQTGNGPIGYAERPLHVGLVAPYLNVYESLTARENLRFLARARRLREAEGRIERVLERVGLLHRADELVSRYSSGMKQRVKYAAALLAEPPLLLLDEPSSNLDRAGLDLVESVVAEQARLKRLLIVATNVPAEAERCDAVLSISDFR